MLSDVVDGAGVFLYRDSSIIAPLLDMRRRFKAVMDVLNSMVRFGISFARSVELTHYSVGQDPYIWTLLSCYCW